VAPAQPPNSAEELRRLRLLVDHLPAMIGYWDRNLRNIVANDAYLKYFGKAPHQVRGRHIREVLGEAVYALNLPYIMGALAGREQLFERELIDPHGVARHTLVS
jgi:PAS domain S-box-containing protein